MDDEGEARLIRQSGGYTRESQGQPDKKNVHHLSLRIGDLVSDAIQTAGRPAFAVPADLLLSPGKSSSHLLYGDHRSAAEGVGRQPAERQAHARRQADANGSVVRCRVPIFLQKNLL